MRPVLPEQKGVGAGFLLAGTVASSIENDSIISYYLFRGWTMELQYTYWQDGDFFVGFLDDYPNDSTQGLSLAELEEALVEIYEIRQEEKKHLATIRKTGKILIPA